VTSKWKHTFATAAALGLAVPASGQTSAASTVSADDPRIDIVAKRLCHAEPVIGTRIAVKRKCDTPAQLTQFRQQAREIIEDYKRRPCMAGTGGGENDSVLPC